MAKRFDSFDDLCLTGSQVGSAANSARGSSTGVKTPGRPNSIAGVRPKPSKKVLENGKDVGASSQSFRKGSVNQSSLLNSARSNIENKSKTTKNQPPPSSREDYLSLFESSHQPKIGKQKPDTSAKIWGSATSGAVGDFTDPQAQPSVRKKFTHSIFQPTSARTNSPYDDDCDDSYENDYVSSKQRNIEGVENKPANHPHSGFVSEKNLDSFLLDAANFSTSANMDKKRNNVGTSRPDSSTKSDKDGIANNMTLQGLQTGNKASLLSLENSYRNIKPKTPVNQVRQKSRSKLLPKSGTVIAEDYIKTCNMAAAIIQRWYRRHSKFNAKAELKRLLGEKQEKILAERNSEIRKEEEKRRTKEEKAKVARQQAIQELQKKREEKRQHEQKVAEEEIAYLQSTGKISKTPSGTKMSNIKKMATTRSVSGTSKNGFVPENVQINASNQKQEKFSGEKNVESCNTPGESKSPTEVGAAGVPSSTANSQTRTTIDDIMETLRKLEDETDSRKKDRVPGPLDWLDELETKKEPENDGMRLSKDTLLRLDSSKDNVLKSGFLSDEKLSSIMNYLEKVEADDRLADIDQELQQINDALEKPILLVPSSEEIAQMEQASIAASEVTQQMLNQKMELEEKKRSMQTLQKALNQQRELSIRYAKETEKDVKKRLDGQKKEYEDTISRHLAFIDQLIEDKKQLTEKLETLQNQYKTMSHQFQTEMKTREESHMIELKKLKDINSATDQLKREKWIKSETRRIKELTVKGFEPELQRLIAQHKSELTKIKSIHQAELLAADERAAQRYVKMTEELRDQLASETESACTRERDLARQTFEKQLMHEQEIFQQQRQRLYNEVKEEKERLARDAAKQRAELDRLQQRLEESHSAAGDSLRKEYEAARAEQERRHAAEIKQLREQLSLEKEAWEENYRKKQDTQLMQKEREMREQVKKDRDREIELAIRSLEDERQSEITQCKRDAENQIRRIRDKYEREMAELERSEKQISEKYNQTKANLVEVEGDNERFKVILKQKDIDISEMKSLLDKRNQERDRISEVVRQEIADKVVATEEENKTLKKEMCDLKARQRLELERVKAEAEVAIKAKSDEMDEVHKRVKEAITKRAKVEEDLKKERDAALKRADYVEQLLMEQRKQVLGKK